MKPQGPVLIWLSDSEPEAPPEQPAWAAGLLDPVAALRVARTVSRHLSRRPGGLTLDHETGIVYRLLTEASATSG